MRIVLSLTCRLWINTKRWLTRLRKSLALTRVGSLTPLWDQALELKVVYLALVIMIGVLRWMRSTLGAMDVFGG